MVSIYLKFLFQGFSDFSLTSCSPYVIGWFSLIVTCFLVYVIIFILYYELFFVIGYILGCGRITVFKKEFHRSNTSFMLILAWSWNTIECKLGVFYREAFSLLKPLRKSMLLYCFSRPVDCFSCPLFICWAALRCSALCRPVSSSSPSVWAQSNMSYPFEDIKHQDSMIYIEVWYCHSLLWYWYRLGL